MWYSRPSDNQSADPVMTSTNTIADPTTDPFTRLNDLDPASSMTFGSSLSGVWDVIFDFTGKGTYEPIEWALAFGTNWCQTAGNTRGARWEINSSNSWSSPAFSKNMTLPAPSYFPVGLQADLSTIVGYTSSYKWLRLVFTDSAPIKTPPRIGEVWFGDRREVPSLTLGHENTPKYPAIVHKTPAGRRISYSKEVRDSHIAGYNYYNDDDWESLRLLSEDARGEVRPFPLQMDDNGEPMLVNLTKFQQFRTSSDLHAVQMEFDELVNDLVP